MTIEEFVHRFRYALIAATILVVAVCVWAMLYVEVTDDPDIARCRADGGTAHIRYADSGARKLESCEIAP